MGIRISLINDSIKGVILIVAILIQTAGLMLRDKLREIKRSKSEDNTWTASQRKWSGKTMNGSAESQPPVKLRSVTLLSCFFWQ